MGLETNVCRRGHVYYLRARVPKDLVSRLKRREIWKSLGERNPSVARALAAKERLRLFQLFDFLRASPLLTDEQIQIAVKKFFETELEIDAALRRSPRSIPEMDVSSHIETLNIFHQELKNHTARGEFVLVEDEAQAIAEQLGISTSPDDRDYRKLRQIVARTKIESTRVAIARWAGNWAAETPLDPLVASALTTTLSSEKKEVETVYRSPTHSTPRRIRSGKTINEVLEEFLKERDTGVPAYSREFRQSISWFVGHFGALRTIDSFTWEDLHDYAELLRITPARWKIRYPGATLLEAIERNKIDKHNVLDAGTINNTKLGNLQTLFGWAFRKRYISADPSVSIKIDTPKTKAKEKRRTSFTASDLNALFQTPLFTGCQSYSSWTKPGTYFVRDHRFWLPLLGLFTGTRLSEIAQLLVEDVFEEDGAWFFRVSDEESETASDRRVKSIESRRSLPIHIELQEIGFLSFVADQKSKGETRLFPECERSKSGKFDSFSKFFRRVLNNAGTSDYRKVFHSFRHTMEDAMREAGLEDTIMFKLAGRTLRHSSGGYGIGDTPKYRKRLTEAYQKIEFDGLDIRHLHGAYPAELP